MFSQLLLLAWNITTALLAAKTVYSICSDVLICNGGRFRVRHLVTSLVARGTLEDIIVLRVTSACAEYIDSYTSGGNDLFDRFGCHELCRWAVPSLPSRYFVVRYFVTSLVARGRSESCLSIAVDSLPTLIAWTNREYVDTYDRSHQLQVKRTLCDPVGDMHSSPCIIMLAAGSPLRRSSPSDGRTRQQRWTVAAETYFGGPAISSSSTADETY